MISDLGSITSGLKSKPSWFGSSGWGASGCSFSIRRRKMARALNILRFVFDQKFSRPECAVFWRALPAPTNSNATVWFKPGDFSLVLNVVLLDFDRLA